MHSVVLSRIRLDTMSSGMRVDSVSKQTPTVAVGWSKVSPMDGGEPYWMNDETGETAFEDPSEDEIPATGAGGSWEVVPWSILDEG